MGYMDYETGETPEERRMRLLAEMGSPFLGNRPDADLSADTVDSGGMFGFAPQGFTPQPDSLTGVGSSPYLDPGQARVGASRNPPWMDPGQTPGGSGRDYVEPPPRLGNLFSKPQEPAAPEQDGILYNGTRSPAGRGVLAQETPEAAIPSGPIASPSDINVTGANGQDRTNAPRPPDAPKTVAPNLPSMAGGLGAGPAGGYVAGRVGVGPAPAATGGAAVADTAAAPPSQPGAPGLAPPQAAAIADGLSRKPGSPAATNWLAENADLFIAIGAGLLSGRNIGEGIIQGLRLANEQKSSSAKQKLQDEKNMAENLKRASHAAALQKAFGMSPELALAQSEDADLVKRAQQQLYPDKESGPDWVREKDANGTDVLRNIKTGDMKAAPKAETADKPARPLTAAEKAQWGIPTDDTRPYSIQEGKAPTLLSGQPTLDSPTRPLSAAEKTQWGIPQDDNRPYAIQPGKAPTLIGGQQPFETPEQAAKKVEETGRVNASVDQATKLSANRLQAQTNVSLARNVRDLLNQVEPGAITGSAAALRDKFGLNIDANGGKVQALQASLERLANDQHKVGTGAVSDADLRSFAKQVPSLMGTKEGNALIMDTIQGVAEYNDAATALASRWKSGDISLREMNKQIEALPNPLERARSFQSERAPAPAAPAAAAPSGPRRIRVDAQGNILR